MAGRAGSAGDQRAPVEPQSSPCRAPCRATVEPQSGHCRLPMGNIGSGRRGGLHMGEAYIVEAVRTPVGRRGGGLSRVHPADLGAHALTALIERSGIDPAAVDEVVFGCLDQVGPQSTDVARTCWLAAGLPESVPGTTIDRQCGSSQQAVSYAAMAVLSGVEDLVVAGGVQNMSMIPIQYSAIAAGDLGFGDPFTGSTG